MVEVARSVRSGIVESRHFANIAVATAEGEQLATWGDPDERFFFRSAIKPFQATAAQEAGASLDPLHMALACASHTAQPVHVALVRQMLTEVGLTEEALGTPHQFPGREVPPRRIARHGPIMARRVFYNCSGKHAAFLRASKAGGWSLQDYLDPGHPIQLRSIDLVGEMTGEPATPAGVDGCGAAAPSGSVSGLARAFARLSVEDRLLEARRAMGRYPALVGSNHRADSRIASRWGGVVKGGASGTIAAGRNGIGIAVKAADGLDTVAAVGLLATMEEMGWLTAGQRAHLAGIAAPVVYGGGRPVGRLEPVSLPSP